MYRSRTGNRTSLLYHRRVSRLTGGTTLKLLAGLAMLGTAALLTDRLDAAGPVDRLDQFRTLARARSMANGAADSSPDAYREMYALLDEEIVESLGTGGLYASTAFLQDQLDAFGVATRSRGAGGATIAVAHPAARGRRRPRTCSAPRRRAARSCVGPPASSTAGTASCARPWPSSSTGWLRVTRRGWRGWWPTRRSVVAFRPRCDPTPRAMPPTAPPTLSRSRSRRRPSPRPGR